MEGDLKYSKRCASVLKFVGYEQASVCEQLNASDEIFTVQGKANSSLCPSTTLCVSVRVVAA